MNPRVVPTALRLLLDEFGEGQTNLVLDVPPEALALVDADYAFGHPVRVVLSVRRALEMFALAGTASTRVVGECCRCLAAAEAPVEAQIRLLLQRQQATDDELEAAKEDDEVEFLSPGAREFDVTDTVRQALILELPVRVYCRDDCRGLCPCCGQDLNQGECGCANGAGDPRWKALAGIKLT
jgi:uncharacterized protein